MLRAAGKLPNIKPLTAALTISITLVAMMTALLLWPANEVDRISRNRDEAVISLVLKRAIARVSHAQESSTVWDLAVVKLRERPLNDAWVDVNMGTWFYHYTGHDEVYILDAQSRPLYVMQEGKRVKSSAYRGVRSVIQPFVDRLKKAPKPIGPSDDGLPMLSAGFSDLAIVRGRPSIVSAKPVVTDTGTLKQKRGTEAVHISVLHLDGGFIGYVAKLYGLERGRYSATGALRSGEAAIPLISQTYGRIGYFVWRPFAPGASVTAYIAPTVFSVLVVAGIAIIFLMRRLGRRTLDLEASRAQAEHLALHDALTGLPNRAMFESRLDQALEEAQRGGRQVALLYVDLDRFKQVNDSLGHPAGDTLIRAVASRLSAEVRHSDTVARLGGDEFAIILRNVSCLNDVNDVCARVVKDLSRPFDLSGAQSFIGASVGVAIAPQDGGDRNELIRKADIALYKAKTDGRNQFALFSPSLDDAVRYREEMDRDLRQALLDNDAQLGLVYQPVFASDGARINGVEALIRWLHPKRGLINPADFIPFAEESGLIEQLGEWVLRCALRDAVRWPELRLSVNISPVQIRNRGFTMRVLRLLQASGMDASRLELEITETALMEGSSDIAETLATLRRNGISIALDDFGTGYSSLSHIRDIAVDRVKIDRSFVSAIEAGNGRALIQAIVTLARANGLKLTAEGIETSAQMDFLKQVGCDEFQGYLLARPITADAIDTVVQAAQTPNQHSGAAKKAV